LQNDFSKIYDRSDAQMEHLVSERFSFQQFIGWPLAAQRSRDRSDQPELQGGLLRTNRADEIIAGMRGLNSAAQTNQRQTTRQKIESNGE
jgi:IS5 family transposase